MTTSVRLGTRPVERSIWMELAYPGTNPPLALFERLSAVGWTIPATVPPPADAIDWTTPDPVTGESYSVGPYDVSGILVHREINPANADDAIDITRDILLRRGLVAAEGEDGLFVEGDAAIATPDVAQATRSTIIVMVETKDEFTTAMAIAKGADRRNRERDKAAVRRPGQAEPLPSWPPIAAHRAAAVGSGETFTTDPDTGLVTVTPLRPHRVILRADGNHVAISGAVEAAATLRSVTGTDCAAWQATSNDEGPAGDVLVQLLVDPDRAKSVASAVEELDDVTMSVLALVRGSREPEGEGTAGALLVTIAGATEQASAVAEALGTIEDLHGSLLTPATSVS